MISLDKQRDHEIACRQNMTGQNACVSIRSDFYGHMGCLDAPEFLPAGATRWGGEDFDTPLGVSVWRG